MCPILCIFFVWVVNRVLLRIRGEVLLSGHIEVSRKLLNTQVAKRGVTEEELLCVREKVFVIRELWEFLNVSLVSLHAELVGPDEADRCLLTWFTTLLKINLNIAFSLSRAIGP